MSQQRIEELTAQVKAAQLEETNVLAGIHFAESEVEEISKSHAKEAREISGMQEQFKGNSASIVELKRAIEKAGSVDIKSFERKLSDAQTNLESCQQKGQESIDGLKARQTEAKAKMDRDKAHLEVQEKEFGKAEALPKENPEREAAVDHQTANVQRADLAHRESEQALNEIDSELASTEEGFPAIVRNAEQAVVTASCELGEAKRVAQQHQKASASVQENLDEANVTSKRLNRQYETKMQASEAMKRLVEEKKSGIESQEKELAGIREKLTAMRGELDQLNVAAQEVVTTAEKPVVPVDVDQPAREDPVVEREAASEAVSVGASTETDARPESKESPNGTPMVDLLKESRREEEEGEVLVAESAGVASTEAGADSETEKSAKWRLPSVSKKQAAVGGLIAAAILVMVAGATQMFGNEPEVTVDTQMAEQMRQMRDEIASLKAAQQEPSVDEDSAVAGEGVTRVEITEDGTKVLDGGTYNLSFRPAEVQVKTTFVFPQGVTVRQFQFPADNEWPNDLHTDFRPTTSWDDSFVDVDSMGVLRQEVADNRLALGNVFEELTMTNERINSLEDGQRMILNLLEPADEFVDEETSVDN